MYVICSLDLEKQEIKLYDSFNDTSLITQYLKNVAENFIKINEGEAKVPTCFKDDVLDKNITTDGYFLRYSTEKPNQIDVFKRTTVLGYFMNDVSVARVMWFGVTEGTFGQLIEMSGKSVTKPNFKSAQQENCHALLMNELANRLNSLNKQREEAEDETEEGYNSEDTDDDSDDEYDESDSE